MSLLKLSYLGKPNLSFKSTKLEPKSISSPGISALIQNMTDTVKHHGLDAVSAPLVGQSLQVIVVNSNNPVIEILGGTVIINPELMILDSVGSEFAWEYSPITPGYSYRISRPKLIGVSFINQRHINRSVILAGLGARLILQQIDYFSGIIPMSRVQSLTLDIRTDLQLPSTA